MRPFTVTAIAMMSLPLAGCWVGYRERRHEQPIAHDRREDHSRRPGDRAPHHGDHDNDRDHHDDRH